MTASFSLIRTQAGATITDGGNNLAANTDPLFAAAGLADNGGPTQTISLQATSPLKNVGSTTLTTDQRGVTRPIGTAPDIGAVEIQTAVPTVPPVKPSLAQISWNEGPCPGGTKVKRVTPPGSPLRRRASSSVTTMVPAAHSPASGPTGSPSA